ncbi:MAG: hypothetical protein VXW28_06720, partial [Candidatus Thermoplasmatota archaeon]|nr:hypothetical protein [Candidatus Thermoplasmatota archaeon]
MDLAQINDAISGSRRSLARTLSAIENGSININDVKQNVTITNKSLATNWQSLAITGAPGVGKSCLIDKLLSI